MRFVKPLDEKLLNVIFKKYKTIITIENGTIIGGFGTAILEFAAKNEYKNVTIKTLGFPDDFIPQGSVDELFNNFNLSEEQLKKVLLNL